MLLTLRSLAGSGPVVGTPSFGAVAVLAAHPDDESLGCAGTLALLADQGATIAIAFATDGEATRGAATDAAETARRRRSEAAAACRILGLPVPAFWGLPDGSLPAAITELAPRIGALVRGMDALFLPWFLDGHPDHEALSVALAGAGAPDALEIWGYETWAPLPANRIVDVTSVWDRKRAAIAAHVTAAQAFDLEAALGLNRWRSIHGLMGRGYAEGFLAAPLDRYLDLSAPGSSHG
jgi:LmbE family N-acetylglucosaminyl deacetylase